MEGKTGSKIVGATLWAYVDRLSVQLVSTMVSIILARIIAPEAYGIISVALIFVNFLDVFVEVGFNSALIRKQTPDSLDYSTMFWFNIGAGVIIYVILYFFAPIIEGFWKLDGLTGIIRVLALKIPFVSIFSIQLIYVKKNLLYKKYFFVSLVGTIVSSIVALYMVLNGYGVWALVFNALTKSIIDMFMSFILIPWKPTFEFSFDRFKSLYSYGKNILLAKIVDIAYVELSGIVMAKKYTSTDLALYNRGRKFPQLILTTINSSISDVLFTVFSDEQDNSEKLKMMLRQVLKMCNYILLPFMFGFLGCAKSFVGAILTEKWMACVPYLQLMCIYYMCIPISSVIYQGIKAIGASHIIFRLESAKKGIGIILLVGTVIAFKEPISIAYSVLISMLLSTILDIVVANQYLSYSFYELFKDNIKILIINFLMLIVIVSLQKFNFGYVATLAIQVLLGILIYIVLSRITKVREYEQAKELIKRKLKKSGNK